jgi:hypothetical protein
MDCEKEGGGGDTIVGDEKVLKEQKFPLFPLPRSNSTILTFADRRPSAPHCQQQQCQNNNDDDDDDDDDEEEEQEETPLSEMKERTKGEFTVIFCSE